METHPTEIVQVVAAGEIKTPQSSPVSKSLKSLGKEAVASCFRKRIKASTNSLHIALLLGRERNQMRRNPNELACLCRVSMVGV